MFQAFGVQTGLKDSRLQYSCVRSLVEVFGCEVKNGNARGLPSQQSELHSTLQSQHSRKHSANYGSTARTFNTTMTFSLTVNTYRQIPPSLTAGRSVMENSMADRAQGGELEVGSPMPSDSWLETEFSACHESRIADAISRRLHGRDQGLKICQ
jgi:hypothetical protein